MKNRLLHLVVALLLTSTALAIRPRLVPFNFPQKDGTTISVLKHGDGHLAFYSTLDGKILTPGDDGSLYYARIENGRIVPTDRLAHNAELRSADEQAYVASQALDGRAAAVQRAAAPRRAMHPKAIASSTPDGLGQYGKSGMGAVSSIGEYTIPVIMVQFKDKKFRTATTPEKLTRYLNDEGYSEEAQCVGSVRDYFRDQSGGMFVPTFEVVATVTLDNNVSYYGGNITDRNSEYYGYDKGLAEDNYFVVESVKKAVAAGVDFSKFEVDGNVPLVSIFYAGYGEATGSPSGGAANTLWPCEWDIDETIAGTHFNSYFVGNELDNTDKLMGMGVFCHEFGHALGLPDFYCTDYSYDTAPVGEWSIMDMGAYVNDSRAPIGYTAYERSYLGWIDLPELTAEQAVTLGKFGTDALPSACRIKASTTENFVLSNHQPGKWYPARFGSGLMVMRIAYNATNWEWNDLNNTQSKQRIKLITADGNTPSYYSSSQKSLWGNGVDKQETWTQLSGTKLNKPIYKVTKNADGTIGFNYLSETIAEKDTLSLKEDDVFTATDGTAYRYAGNHEVWFHGKAKAEAATTSPERVVIPAETAYGETPLTVVGIDKEALSGDEAVTYLYIGSNVREIAAGALDGMSALATIDVDEANNMLMSVDGVLLTRGEVYPEPFPTQEARRRAAQTRTATFDFAANPWGLPASSNAAKDAGNLTEPLVVDDVTLSFTNGSTATRLWDAATGTELRFYRNGGSITFSVPEGQQITSITFNATKFNVEASTGTLTDSQWTGEAESVTFTATNTTCLVSVALTVSTNEPTPVELLRYPVAREGTAYDVPGGIAAIADRAFEDSHLEQIFLPSSLTWIGHRGLSIPTLKQLWVNSTTPCNAAEDAFDGIDFANCQIVIATDEDDNAYRDATGWSNFFAPETSITLPQADRNTNAGILYDLQGRQVRGTLRGGVYVGSNGQKTMIR